MSSVAKFNEEVALFADRIAPNKFMLFYRKIVLMALRSIVLKTPVDTGRARGNWQVTINVPHEGQSDQEDRTGNKTISAGMSIMRSVPNYGLGQIVFISNNVEYIEDLEDGRSVQAPEGMVEPTVRELSGIFER